MKKMSLRILCAVMVIAVSLLAMSGCKMTTPVVSNTAFPADASTYEILGRVEMEVPKAKAGYTKLLDYAKRKYPQTDDVVNIMVDAAENAFTSTYIMSGIAIRYK